MRHVLGPKLAAFSVSTSTGATGTSTGATSTPGAAKIDLHPSPVGMEPNAKGGPLVHFHITAVDPTTHSKLCSITVIVLPSGHGEPTDADAWMASSYSKATVDTAAISTVAAEASTPAPVPVPVPVATPVADPATSTVPVISTSPTATATVAATVTTPAPASAPAASVTVATPAVPTASTPATSLVSVQVPDVPNGNYNGQVIYSYDS